MMLGTGKPIKSFFVSKFQMEENQIHNVWMDGRWHERFFDQASYEQFFL